MKILSILSFGVFLALNAFAQTPNTPKELTLEWEGKSVQIPFFNVHGLLMNDLCKNDLDKCAAYQAHEKVGKGTFKPQVVQNVKQFSNPAAVFCKSLYGTPMRLSDAEKNEWSICAFKDKTMADSWGLYRNQKPVNIK